jgi:hypothetical protein
LYTSIGKGGRKERDGKKKARKAEKGKGRVRKSRKMYREDWKR